MSEYFPKAKSSGGRVKVELDLSDYATKADLKNQTGVVYNWECVETFWSIRKFLIKNCA